MRYRFKGMKEYIDKLNRLSNPFNTEACIDVAVSKGSEIVGEITRQELQNLPTDDRPGKVDYRKGIRSLQKKFLIEEFGITPLANDNGFINKKTGVGTGRLDYKGGGYTYAVVLARSLEKGTSFMPKNAVFSRASRKARKPCLEAMEQSLNESIEAICLNNFKRSQRSK